MKVFKVLNEYGYAVGIEDEKGHSLAGYASDGKNFFKSNVPRDIEELQCDECGGFVHLDANGTCCCNR